MSEQKHSKGWVVAFSLLLAAAAVFVAIKMRSATAENGFPESRENNINGMYRMVSYWAGPERGNQSGSAGAFLNRADELRGKDDTCREYWVLRATRIFVEERDRHLANESSEELANRLAYRRLLFQYNWHLNYVPHYVPDIAARWATCPGFDTQPTEYKPAIDTETL